MRDNPQPADEEPQSAEAVVVVGGGLAGLAAATSLAEAGVPVTVVESRPRLGGRASSFTDHATGETIDNCQHVGMGCCTNLRAFVRSIGVEDRFRVERELTFIDADGRHSRFAASRLPAPMHLGRALAGLRYFSWREKLSLARGIRRLARDRSTEGSLREWLERAGQPPRVRRLFWHVVMVSALSETLENVSVTAARKVIADGFLRHREAWQVHLPAVPLDELYGPPVERFLSERGGRVLLNRAVTAVDIGKAAIEVATRSDETLMAGDVILALPHHRVAGVLPEELQDIAAGAAALSPAPIASVHLWFDRPITDLPHAVFVDHLSQWMFRRPDSAEGDAYYQVVISAAHDVEAGGREETVDRVLRELRSVFPDAVGATVTHCRVVVERRAVFSPLPESDRHRPPQATRVPRLHLAGDWTATGWPATMEGAVRSGYLAAQSVLRRRGVARQLIAEDLPAARFSRWLGLVP